MKKNLTAWSVEELKILMEHYPNGGSPMVRQKIVAAGIAARSKNAVIGKARKLGLKSSSTGYFKKGLIPHNKGQKMSAELRDKVKHTFFKNGSLPSNTTLYDYAVNLRNGSLGWKYWVVRVGKRNWAHLHVWCWCMENGDLPPGHMIRMNSNHDFDALVRSMGFPERAPKQEPAGQWERLLKLVEAAQPLLECITMQENAIRNSGSLNLTDGYIVSQMTRKNPEIKELLQLAPDVIDLKRQVYQHKRQIKSLENGNV